LPNSYGLNGLFSTVLPPIALFLVWSLASQI
jgi:hypothetical protein